MLRRERQKRYNTLKNIKFKPNNSGFMIDLFELVYVYKEVY